MNFDFDSLKHKIEEATIEAFKEMVSKHKAEGIYAFALYSDDGAMTVCPATNTLKHLEKADKDDFAYYKFSEAEWAYEGDGANKKFEDICTIVRNEVLEKEDDEKWFNKFQGTLYATCIEVLINLKNKNFFKNTLGSDIFLNFEVTEYEFPNKKIKEIIASLNDNEYKNEYFEWMKSWEEE
jgi:hypothetical protein